MVVVVVIAVGPTGTLIDAVLLVPLNGSVSVGVDWV